MGVQGPVAVPWPLSSFPGSNSQESQGRLVNVFAEPIGENNQGFRWLRSAGLSLQAATGNSGYRGGLVVNSASVECWANNASKIDATGNITSIGNFPGTANVSIARNQASPTPDVVAVDPATGAYVLESATVTPATATVTIGGSVFMAGDVIVLDILNEFLSPPFPVSISHTLGAGETASTIASALNTALNANAACIANNISSTVAGAVLTVAHQGSIGNATNLAGAVTPVATGNETITFAPTNGFLTGSGSSWSATATIGGTVFLPGDVIALEIANTAIGAFPVTVDYTVVSGDTTTTIATGLKAAIDANSTLSSHSVTATSSGAAVTVTHAAAAGSTTQLIDAMTPGNETITLAPSSGDLSGGAGTYGAFTGIPTLYTGDGNLSAPNSVCNQDGYFFFTEPNGTVYATTLNGLAMNALTFIMVQSKADVTLLRGIPFSGLLLLFTTGSCELWQDGAISAPDFPYVRSVVLDVGLIQGTAIAGWETGFAELLWVAQDFSVHWMTAGALAQVKASPPDLDKLIEVQIRAGNTIEAGCYIAGGKKFWTISSPAWTWEFNLSTKKWTERSSLTSAGIYSRWRGAGGHPAFGKWLMGDQQSGNLFFADDTSATEFGTPMLYRMESLPVKKFPMQIRVARADFDFVVGVGQAVGSLSTNVTGAAAGTGGVVRLAVTETAGMATNDVANVSGITGTTEANGNWPITIIDATHIELQGSVYANAYRGNGVLVDLTSPPNAQSPQVAISMSKDGGFDWGNPLLRPLGNQAKSQRSRVSVTNMGLSGPMGVRWRMDITDPVYASFLGSTMSDDIRAVGA